MSSMGDSKLAVDVKVSVSGSSVSPLALRWTHELSRVYPVSRPMTAEIDSIPHQHEEWCRKTNQQNTVPHCFDQVNQSASQVSTKRYTLCKFCSLHEPPFQCSYNH